VKAKKSYTIPGTDEPIEDHYPEASQTNPHATETNRTLQD
jgi:hypothetical protein